MSAGAPAGSSLTLHAESFGQVMRVWIFGELSYRTAFECRSGLRDPLSGPEPIVIVDVGGLSAIDDSGVEALHTIKRNLEADGRRLLLSSVSRGIARALSIAAGAPPFDVLDGGGWSGAHCGVCDESIPSGLHRCPHCGAVL